MWWQNSTANIRASDEIISDEDELDPVTYDHDCSKDLESLIPQSNKPLCQKLENRYCDREIGVCRFEDEDLELTQSLCSEHPLESDDESISEEENVAIPKVSNNSSSVSIRPDNHFGSEHDRQRHHTWSAAIEEANALAFAQEKNNGCSTISDTSERKGVNRAGKAKVKFSPRPLLHKEHFSCSSGLKDGNKNSPLNAAEGLALHNKPEDKTTKSSVVELLEKLQEEAADLPPDAIFHENKRPGSSMADLLENLQQNNNQSMRRPNLMLQNAKAKQRKMQIVGKSGLSHLGSRILDNEDPLEFDGGGFFSEDEDIEHNQLCTIKDKGQTMADLFEEAFGRSEAEEFHFTSKHSGLGYHGRMQQVLQIEKDRHLELLKYSRSSNDTPSMDVQILSRFLEAKLTVCRCLPAASTPPSSLVISQYGKSAQKCEHDGQPVERTIIFNSKICNNVELEVGKLIRILPPWKDVVANQDERIILCTYFCQIKD